MKAHTKATQASMTPQSAVEELFNGNQRFLGKKLANRDLKEQIHDTAKGQYPFAAVLSCIDSRIPVEILLDQGIGDLFSARIAGNFINEDILGSLEFACKLAGSKAIMVMGHTSCGAVKGACDHAKLGNLTQMLDKIMPAVDTVKTEPGEERNSSNKEFVNRVSEQNVLLAIENIKKQSPVLNEMVENGDVVIVGSMYDVESGAISMVG